MRALRVGLLLFLVSGWSVAADPVSLKTATGTVDKVEGESLSIRPRGADGQFEKSLVLSITGTSRITALTPQTRAGKVVITQRDVEPKDLQAKQPIAVIYAVGSSGPVLLDAVVQRESTAVETKSAGKGKRPK